MGTCPSRFNRVHCLTPCFVIIIFPFTTKTEIFYVFLVFSLRTQFISSFSLSFKYLVTITNYGNSSGPNILLRFMTVILIKTYGGHKEAILTFVVEYFRIQNFPLHVLGSTRSFVSERRTWHSPKLIHRLQHCTEILTQFILTKHFTRRMRAYTVLPPPHQYSFLGDFVTNILRDFLSSGTSLQLQTIGTTLHEVPRYVMF